MNKLTKPKKKPVHEHDEYMDAPEKKLTVKGVRVVPKEDVGESALALSSSKGGSGRPGSRASARSNDQAPRSRDSSTPSEGADIVRSKRGDGVTAKEVDDLERKLSE